MISNEPPHPVLIALSGNRPSFRIADRLFQMTVSGQTMIMRPATAARALRGDGGRTTDKDNNHSALIYRSQHAF